MSALALRVDYGDGSLPATATTTAFMPPTATIGVVPIPVGPRHLVGTPGGTSRQALRKFCRA